MVLAHPMCALLKPPSPLYRSWTLPTPAVSELRERANPELLKGDTPKMSVFFPPCFLMANPNGPDEPKRALAWASSPWRICKCVVTAEPWNVVWLKAEAEAGLLGLN